MQNNGVHDHHVTKRRNETTIKTEFFNSKQSTIASHDSTQSLNAALFAINSAQSTTQCGLVLELVEGVGDLDHYLRGGEASHIRTSRHVRLHLRLDPGMGGLNI